MTAGDEIKALVERSAGPSPNGTLIVQVSAGEIGWERLASDIDSLFERYTSAEVTAVEIQRDGIPGRLGFVMRDAFLQKVRPELGDQTGTQGHLEDSTSPGPDEGRIHSTGPIRRLCTYEESRLYRSVKCGELELFETAPDVMPKCQNSNQNKKLRPHQFEW